MDNYLKTEVNVKQFAINLAHSGDTEQADLINKFAYELKVCCKTSNNVDMQMCCISDKLDSNGIFLIKQLSEFIKLREENAPK